MLGTPLLSGFHLVLNARETRFFPESAAVFLSVTSLSAVAVLQSHTKESNNYPARLLLLIVLHGDSNAAAESSVIGVV